MPLQKLDSSSYFFSQHIYIFYCCFSSTRRHTTHTNTAIDSRVHTFCTTHNTDTQASVLFLSQILQRSLAIIDHRDYRPWSLFAFVLAFACFGGLPWLASPSSHRSSHRWSLAASWVTPGQCFDCLHRAVDPRDSLRLGVGMGRVEYPLQACRCSLVQSIWHWDLMGSCASSGPKDHATWLFMECCFIYM